MKKILTYGLVIFVLLLLLGSIVLARNYFASKASVKALAKAGQPVSLADLADQTQPSGDNAFEHLEGLLEKAAVFVKETDTFLEGPDFSWGGGKHSPKDLETLKKLIESNADVMVGIPQAAKSSHLSFPVDYTVGTKDFFENLNDLIGNQKQISRLASARTKYYATIGEPDSAVMASLDHLRLFGLQHQPCTILGLQGNVSCQRVALDNLNNLMVSNDLSAEIRDRIEIELSKHSLAEAFNFGFRSERAYGLDLMDSQFGFSMQLMGTTANTTKAYCDVMQHMIDCGVGDPYQAKPLGTIKDSVGLVTGLLMPQIERTSNIVHTVRASIRCLRVLNGIQAKTRAEADPKELAIEALGLAANATTDPFDGKPLRIKRTESGWAVYSVGPDQVDDGGSADDEDAADIVIGELITYE